jgi:hypothetical protein
LIQVLDVLRNLFRDQLSVSKSLLEEMQREDDAPAASTQG